MKTAKVTKFESGSRQWLFSRQGLHLREQANLLLVCCVHGKMLCPTIWLGAECPFSRVCGRASVTGWLEFLEQRRTPEESHCDGCFELQLKCIRKR